MRDVRSVVLSHDETDYLLSAGFLPLALRQRLQSKVNRRLDDTATFELSAATAEEVREALTEQLAKVGFDEAYEPTDEGSLLEELIDRFLGPQSEAGREPG